MRKTFATFAEDLFSAAATLFGIFAMLGLGIILGGALIQLIKVVVS